MNCYENKNQCGEREVISIPRGNDFMLYLCGLEIVPGMADMDFGDVENLKIYVTSFGKREEVTYQTDNGKDVILFVSADIQRCTKYGLEMEGTYEGHRWRWKCGNAFRIVDSNCEASDNAFETFGVETYYVRDVVWVEFEGETMTLYSDGHVRFEGDALILQDTEDTTFEIDGRILYITTNN